MLINSVGLQVQAIKRFPCTQSKTYQLLDWNGSPSGSFPTYWCKTLHAFQKQNCIWPWSTCGSNLNQKDRLHRICAHHTVMKTSNTDLCYFCLQSEHSLRNVEHQTDCSLCSQDYFGTGIPFKTFKTKNWTELVSFSVRASLALLTIRSLGCKHAWS